MIEYTYNLRVAAARYASTWLALDVLSCLPLECMVSAAGVVDSYNVGHINRWLFGWLGESRSTTKLSHCMCSPLKQHTSTDLHLPATGCSKHAG